LGLWPGTGILIGLLAGFLGVGGGVMTVPILLDVFAMAIGARLAFAHAPSNGRAGQLPPTIVDTPVLSLFSFPIKRAIGAGALFNLARPAGQAMRWAMRCFAWRR
jgi:hypothetical protein